MKKEAKTFALLVLAVTMPVGSSARNAWLWPFASDSPWNLPIGSGARFSALNSPAAQDLLAGGALIHAGQWGMPLYRAASGNPWVSVWDEENRRSFHVQVPRDARPDPMGDGHLFIGDPDGRFVLEMYRARRLPDGGFVARRAFRVDLHGPGMFLHDGRFPGVRAMDASGMGGVLRAWELRAGHLSHALTFLLPYTRLKHGPVWPSSREDYWGFRDYTGHVPIGTLVAIPRWVKLDAMSLSAAGLTLAHALQDYGAYCDDSVGTDGLVLTAEGAAEEMAELQAMRRDFPVIRAALRVVENNTAASLGGGGVPLVALAPGIDR